MATGNEVVGQCVCPLCKRPGANVLKDIKGKFYINCDGCCSLMRSISREGSEAMHAMIVKPDTSPALGTSGAASEKTPVPTGEKKPDAVPAVAGKKKSRGAFLDALAIAAGRRDE